MVAGAGGIRDRDGALDEFLEAVVLAALALEELLCFGGAEVEVGDAAGAAAVRR